MTRCQLPLVGTDPRWRDNEGRLRSFRNEAHPVAFICECGRRDCKRAVLLTPEEYEARRPGLILHDSHDRNPG